MEPIALPGSDEAIKAGCSCPKDENQGGSGAHISSMQGRFFVIHDECEMHGLNKMSGQ